MGVGVQALQFIAALGERIKKAGLLKEAGGVQVSVFLGHGGEVHQHFIHAAVLGAQHALALIVADADPEIVRPLPMPSATARASVLPVRRYMSSKPAMILW